jgi:hypothetical protein
MKAAGGKQQHATGRQQQENILPGHCSLPLHYSTAFDRIMIALLPTDAGVRCANPTYTTIFTNLPGTTITFFTA